jgi:hypothetical protein
MRPIHETSVCANTGEAGTRRQVNQFHGFHDPHFGDVSLIKVCPRDRWDAGHLSAGFNEAAIFVFACVENAEASIAQWRSFDPAMRDRAAQRNRFFENEVPDTRSLVSVLVFMLLIMCSSPVGGLSAICGTACILAANQQESSS